MQSQQKIKTIEHYSYLLNDNIGKGFSSIVYKGKNKHNQQNVAIKVIDLKKLSQSTMKQLLQSEIGIIKSLNHNNVLKCQNVFITINNCYIVTELCTGGDLASEIKRKGRLRGLDALKTMLEITKGVQYLTQLNILHRDIKPANILLHDGVAKIADFGFAKYDEQQGKKQKYSVGSPLYMSPQALFSNLYSKQNDVWSLGVVFYQILQGRPPWDPKNQKQLKQILKQRKQIFFRIAIRDQLQTIIRGCLKYQRTQRLTLQTILIILDKMMKQMLSQDNIAYRQTLTKRNLNTLSCKDLNLNSTNNNVINACNNNNNITARPLMPKIPRPPIINNINNNNNNTNVNTPQIPLLHKQNTKKQQKSTLDTQIIIRNRSAIQLKQKQPIPPLTNTNTTTNTSLPLQQSSRHNHWILKSVINYARLLYKTFTRLDKLQIKQIIRIQIQIILIDLLQYIINYLKQSITFIKQAQKFGIINFDKFKQTRCYSKTILVINQYYQRYTKFISKSKRFLGDKKIIPWYENNIIVCINKFKKCMKQLTILENRNQHNIAIDFLISIIVLSEMLNNYNTAYFAEFSHIQEIVQSQPTPIVDQGDLRELGERLESLVGAF